jgi:transcriptional regulator with XRE-family HTH domain
MSTWSSRIKELRETGLTLAQIGERSGLAPSTISDLEKGRSSSPRGDAALRLFELHREVCGSGKPHAEARA